MKYEIWIPSRGRSDVIGTALALVPNAYVYVNQDKADDYRAVVRPDRLVPHKPTNGSSATRIALLKHAQAECVVMIDDDLQAVSCFTGRRVSYIRKHEDVEQIIRNGMNVALDIGAKAFCWARFASPLMFKPHEPFSVAAPMSCSWGIIGRSPAIDPRFASLSDADLTLQHLMKHRIVWQDQRFYFDHGRIFSGKGGDRLLGADRYKKDHELLRMKWGRYINCGASTSAARKAGTSTNAMAIRVRRKSDLV